MTHVAHDALEARKTLTDAIDGGRSDAVLVSSDPQGPSLWTRGLKMVVYGAVAAAICATAYIGTGSAPNDLVKRLFAPNDEISFDLDEPTIHAFAEEFGPRIFSRGEMRVFVGSAKTEPSARFYTHLDPSNLVQEDNECYAIYQPALLRALGSEVRLENTMESFALAHCIMVGERPVPVTNISGQEDLGLMMTNLAAARLIEANILGEDGRETTDRSSVRDAWFSSQFSQKTRSGITNNIDGLVAYMVLVRADEAIASLAPPATLSGFRENVALIVAQGLGDVSSLVETLAWDTAEEQLGHINEALKKVYLVSPAASRLDRMDAFMANPVQATLKIEAEGVEELFKTMSVKAPLGRVRVADPFPSPDAAPPIEEAHATQIGIDPRF